MGAGTGLSDCVNCLWIFWEVMAAGSAVGRQQVEQQQLQGRVDRQERALRLQGGSEPRMEGRQVRGRRSGVEDVTFLMR